MHLQVQQPRTHALVGFLRRQSQFPAHQAMRSSSSR
ncbi:unnamed protein product [Amoebophrya sp. A25]|nr:unnamed protein product [Amoebophrya sp. A25]|eukprot:GSA25T00004027001.1